MEYRRLGKTNLEVSLLSFGTIKLRADEGIAPEQAAQALNRTLDLGINFVDTARAYSESESYLGQALGEALYQSLEKHAGDCVACRECVERCVLGLDIPAKMEEVAAQFGY